MSHDIAELNKHIKLYIGVFVALLVLTVVTVGVSYLHLPFYQAVIVALAVASVKGTLVVGFFMHLFDEFKERKPWLFWSLVAAVGGFLLVIVLPLLNHLNRLGRDL